jgi:hypothetical protein
MPGAEAAAMTNGQERTIKRTLSKRGAPVQTTADGRTYREILQDVPALSGCTSDVLKEFVAHGMVKVHCAPGKSFGPQTVRDHNVYVLVGGSAILDAGDDIIIDLEPGDYFGRNHNDHGHLVASIVALTHLEVVAISPEVVAQLKEASCRDRHPSQIEWRSWLVTNLRLNLHHRPRRTSLVKISA